MSNWDDRVKLAEALISATRDEETGKQREVGVQIGTTVAEIKFIQVGPGGFIEIEDSDGDRGFVSPDHIVGWGFILDDSSGV